MGDLTHNISRHELACKCGCGLDTMDWETIQIVQETCDHFANKLNLPKVVLIITSAARCYPYNRVPVSEGGPGSNDNSQHPKCRAIDFRIKGVSTKEIYNYLDKKYPNQYGIGYHRSFVHFDSRGWKARWTY